MNYIRHLCLLLALPFGIAILSGCDSALTPDDFIDEHPKLRHWNLLYLATSNGNGNGGGNSGNCNRQVDVMATFSDLVDDPEGATEILFSAQGIRKRSYFRDSIKGVSLRMKRCTLYEILDDVLASDSLAFMEPDVPTKPRVHPRLYVDLETYRNGHGNSGAGSWYEDQYRSWSIELVGGPESSTVSGDGADALAVDVYVIDGPIDHPDINVVERISFIPEGATPDTPLHGTHIAGIIGAIDDRDGIVGLAPGTPIHSLEVLGASGGTSMSVLIDAVEFVTERKQAQPGRPLVVSMSIGMDVGSTDQNALDEAVSAAVEAGVVFVVSAGNDKADAATYSPAHAPGALVVASTNEREHFSRSFSNDGPEVDLLAPGEDVLSTADGERYAVMSGTSMATPHVAGAAALYLSRNPTATPAEVQAALQSAAEAIGNPPSGTTNQRLSISTL